MFGLPSFGKAASRCILRESQAAALLEEVDEDDLALGSDSSTEPCNAHNRAVLSAAVLLAACCVALQLFTLTAVLSLFGVCGYLLVVVGEWRLKTFVQKMGEIDVMARKANRALLQREMLSFGLGLSKSQALLTCRLHVFVCCKDNVLYLSSLAEGLVSAKYMAEERRRLISGFYTEEMQELVHSSASSESSHITQRGIGALLDLFVLHRSEVLRLLVLYLLRSPIMPALTLLFRVFFVFQREIDVHIERLRVITNTLSRNRSRETRTHSSLELVKVNELDVVALSLEDIITGITNGELNVDDVKRALKRVLSMRAFVGPKTAKHEEKDAEDPELADNPDVTWRRSMVSELASSAPLCDEVYEVIASSEDAGERDVHSFEEDDYSIERSRELMGELRLALASRAAEFATRERKALAAFYGVSDAELDALEESQKRQHPLAEAARAEERQDKLYGSPEQSAEPDDQSTPSAVSFEQNRAHALPADLLSALRMRSVAEEVIGDDDD